MALSSYPGANATSSNPFYDAQSKYWWGGPEFPFHHNGLPQLNWGFGEQNPEGPWTSYLAKLGYGGLDPKGQWGRSLYGRAQEGYTAAQQTNPGLMWQDYLHTLNIPHMYAGLGPDEKGFNDAQFGGPARWQRRV